MKYLLSTGKSTTDQITYIKDLIKIHMLIRINEIPYWDGGSDDLIPVLQTTNVVNEVRRIIEHILTTIGTRFRSINLVCQEVYILGSVVRVSLKIGDIVENIDIKRSN